jgi:hypothetical protein
MLATWGKMIAKKVTTVIGGANVQLQPSFHEAEGFRAKATLA